MKKILIVNRFYGYGTTSGGPVFSIRNLLRMQVSHRVSTFSLATDFKQLSGENLVDQNFVFPEVQNNFERTDLSVIAKLKLRYRMLKDNELIYLNSFFDLWFSLSFVVLNLLFRNKTIIVSPRGELMSGALSIKKYRKLIFIYVFRLLGLHRRVSFHFTSNDEFRDALRHFRTISYFILPNVVAEPISDRFQVSSRAVLRVMYLSRITPKKGLMYAIELLSKFPAPILDVYGVIDDFDYYSQCRSLAVDCGVGWAYKGHVDLGSIRFSDYHFSILPTRGENFGHAIYDSLSNGLPVVIGPSTPWFDAVKDSKSSCVLTFDKESDLRTLRSLINFLKRYPEIGFEESLDIAELYYRKNLVCSHQYCRYFEYL